MRIAIIGGRGGTTTLYHYLGAHAKVCLSSTKETRFFRRQVAHPLYDNINLHVDFDLQIASLLLDELQAYYRHDRDALEAMLGHEFVSEFDPKLSRVEIAP